MEKIKCKYTYTVIEADSNRPAFKISVVASDANNVGDVVKKVIEQNTQGKKYLFTLDRIDVLDSTTVSIEAKNG